jgi:hypothetical protein
MLRSLSPFFSAFFAQAIQDNSFGIYREVILDMIRDPDVIVFIGIKIYDLSAMDTVKMMMVVHGRIKSARPSLRLHDIDQADFRQRQQRSVHRVIRNVGKFHFYDVEHFIGRGMIFCLHELFVYSATLRSDLQVEFLAVLYEWIEAIGNLIFLHIIIK